MNPKHFLGSGSTGIHAGKNKLINYFFNLEGKKDELIREEETLRFAQIHIERAHTNNSSQSHSYLKLIMLKRNNKKN